MFPSDWCYNITASNSTRFFQRADKEEIYLAQRTLSGPKMIDRTGSLGSSLNCIPNKRDKISIGIPLFLSHSYSGLRTNIFKCVKWVLLASSVDRHAITVPAIKENEWRSTGNLSFLQLKLINEQML